MENKLYRIAVVCGGPSSEAAISRVTGRGIFEALQGRYTAQLFEYTPDLAEHLRAFSPQLVIPAMHGKPGEDGTLQGFLEVLGYPYVGSGVLASAVAMHKPTAKLVYAQAGLRTPRGWVLTADTCQQVDFSGVHQLVVKPLDEGSALGITFTTPATLATTFASILEQTDKPMLVEERIVGWEITCGVLDKQGKTIALPVTQIQTPEGSWYDFEHRYTPGLSGHIVPAPLPPALYAEVQRMSVAAHVALGCRDLSRSDFVVTETAAYILETNTIPGMTPTSLYPEAAAAYGLDFAGLLDVFVRNHLA
ncbi:MAG: D-alanine--D-alanine ligase [Alphaproteobacteria bacterium]